MINRTPGSISIRTDLQFDECVRRLRQQLRGEQFCVVCQLELHREFESALGLPWRKHIILVVWNSFYAYRALLNGEAEGLLLPINISVSDLAGRTVVTAPSHSQAGVAGQRSLGTQILERELNRKMEQILMEFHLPESTTVSSVTLASSKQSI